jgi:hypothetical protein
MLSIGFCDHIDKVPNFTHYSILCTTRVGYYYHLVNVISLNLSQSDHIKPVQLYSILKHTYCKLISYPQQVKLKTTSSRIGLYFQEELLPLTDELVSAVCRESQDFGFIVLETGENKVRLG